MIKLSRVMMVVFLMMLLSACVATTAGITGKPITISNMRAAEINAKLGANYLQQGEYAAAQKKLDKALLQNPRSAVVHNVMAALQMQLEVNEKAKFHFERAINLAPEYSEAQNNYGVFLCGQKQYRAAEKRFLAALSNPLYPEAAEAYENAGLCVQRVPDLVAAESYFKQALQLDAFMAKSLLQLARINYNKGDYQQAEDNYLVYRKVARQNPASLLFGIKVADKSGNLDAAASYKLLLQSKYPDSEEAKQVRQGSYQ